MTWHAVGWHDADVPLRGVSNPGDVLIRIARELAYRYAGTFSRETVARYVYDSYELLSGPATTRAHLPALVERFAADRLRAVANARRTPVRRVPEVLFVCTSNVGRSQMAAALLAHHGAGRVHVRSAGSLAVPGTTLDPAVVTAMAEIGVALDRAFPKPLTDDVVRGSDVVVTMGCGDACPVFPGVRYVDWQLDDPIGRPLAQVRRIRDRISDYVLELLGALDAATRPGTVGSPGKNRRPAQSET